jgi:hypothetical protein
LTTVPSAQTATTATSAKTAETATKATSAVTADEAGEAKEADSAKHAKEADRATLAGEAEKLGGKTASQLTLNCDGTDKPSEEYGGMCWDKSTRPISFWVEAVKTCGNAEGRLPLIGELVAYLTHDGNSPGAREWSGSLLGTEKALTSDDEENVSEEGTFELGYRCVYPLSN